MKDKPIITERNIRIGSRLLNFKKPLVMGVLNITHDSFYAGSRLPLREMYVQAAEKMARDGADILDIGAYSTRPGAQEIDEKTEIKNLTDAIKTIKDMLPQMVISADTFRASVAKEAIDAGAEIINDISGGSLDEKMFETVAALQVPYILMHMRGNPQTMQKLTDYKDVVNDVVYELSGKVLALRQMGVADIIIDPGFGLFAKTAAQNFEMLRRLDEFSLFNTPILAGLSRKSMIWRTLNITPGEALNGTTALNMAALQNGADILRVHDVKEAREVITLFELIQKSGHRD